MRRLFESQGLKVSRLLRTSYGSVDLPKELRTGRFIELDRKEIHRLIDLVGIRPREDMGVHGKAKEKKERFQKKPMKARTIRTSSRSGRTNTRNANPSSSNTRGRDAGNRGSKR